jgi:PAS domain S-box-containing protein
VPAWLVPAVGLMNRLSLPKKFALISFCFALPLVLVLLFLHHRIENQVRIARLEMDGVAYLRPLKALHDEIPQAQSLARAYLLGEPFAIEHYPTRQAEIDRIMDQLAEVDGRLSRSLDTAQRHRVLRSGWEDFKGQIAKLSPELATAQFAKLQADVADFMAHVGDQSTLILDPDLDSYYLMDAILLKLPETGAILARARQRVGALSAGGMSESDFNALASDAGLIRANQEKLRRGLQVAFAKNPSGTVQAALDQPLAQSVSAMSTLLGVIDDTMKPGGHRLFSPDQFQNAAALVLMSNNRLWERAADQLVIVLETRIRSLQRDLWLLMAVALAAVCVVTYLWVAFYRATTGTVRRLQEATERMKEGREDILVELETRDELGQVGKAFNTVARQLMHAGRNYRSIFDGSLDGIFRTSLEGVYLEANPALARIYKYPSVDALLQGMVKATNIYVDPRRREQFREQIARDGVVRDFISEVRCADGGTVWINENARAIKDEQGEVLCYEGIVRDISAQIEGEKAVKEAMKAAELANQAKTEFLANMSHEIRTPMNAILGFAELLKGLVTEPRAQSYLQAIASSGETLLALINDVLDLSKIEAGKLELQYEVIDPGLVIRDVRHIFSQKAEQKGLDLQVELDSSLPATVWLDEVRLRQILFNVVGNAIKFTERGHVAIRASSRPDPAQSGHCTLVIEVEDTGIGIPEEEQQRIFEAFSQQSGQSTKKFGGTGLGLTITRRLADMMRGRIEIRSGKGEGTVFRFLFPEVKVAEQRRNAPASIQEPAHDLADLEPGNILVVDDIVMNRDLIRAFFHGTAHRLIEAGNGQEAIDIVRVERPDAILMDVRMPVMDGLQATRLIKEDPALRDIPVIVVTASALQQEEQMLRPICDGFIRKPVSKTDLAGHLRRILKSKPPAERRAAAVALERPVGAPAAAAAGGIPAAGPLRTEWRRLMEAPTVGEVTGFAQRLAEHAQVHAHEALRHYSGRLLAAAQRFDVVAMESILGEFAPLAGEGELP